MIRTCSTQIGRMIRGSERPAEIGSSIRDVWGRHMADLIGYEAFIGIIRGDGRGAARLRDKF